MEVLGFLGAIIGLIAAIINRKRIIVHRSESASAKTYSGGSGKTPITIKKRIKRMFLCLGVSFITVIIFPSDSINVAVWPFSIGLLMAAYQFLAILIVIFARMWR